jgi:hypothetical protein
MHETSKEVALLLRRLAEAVEDNQSVAVLLADETILIPADADVRVEYERGGGAREMVIRVTWGSVSALPVLIHRHSEQVRDTHGHLYDVLIYGEPKAGGTWEGWLEFVPLSASLRTRRTERETTQPDRAALEYWATGLEPLYFAGAFERAA